jgi:hypothetical protein
MALIQEGDGVLAADTAAFNLTVRGKPPVIDPE